MPDISKVQSQLAGELLRATQKQEARPGFADTLKQMVQQVDAMQKDAAEETQKFIAGEQGNLHQVMAAVEEARLGFELLLEVRNRLMESYQEIMRMQV